MARRPTATDPDRKPVVLGLDGFARISAVEGITLSAESLRMFRAFERERLSPEERREAIRRKHAAKG